jgi:hypothetical protein
MRNHQASLVAIAAILALAGCDQAKKAVAGSVAPDLIIHGGPILTMEGDVPTYAQAVAVKDGKISAVGSDADVMKTKDGHTVLKT